METDIAIKYIAYIGTNYKIIGLIPRYLGSHYP